SGSEGWAYDQEYELGEVSPVFEETECEKWEAQEPRHVRDARGRGKTRARGPVLQTSLSQRPPWPRCASRSRARSRGTTPTPASTRRWTAWRPSCADAGPTACRTRRGGCSSIC